MTTLADRLTLFAEHLSEHELPVGSVEFVGEQVRVHASRGFAELLQWVKTLKDVRITATFSGSGYHLNAIGKTGHDLVVMPWVITRGHETGLVSIELNGSIRGELSADALARLAEVLEVGR